MLPFDIRIGEKKNACCKTSSNSTKSASSPKLVTLRAERSVGESEKPFKLKIVAPFFKKI
jgi:hypothetical protein